VYVDDLAATGATAKGTTSRMAKFQDWAENVCGVLQFKRIYPLSGVTT
jgi:adenine/guanine phosphoribosyltransferase-like PRPP-binding protein